jgi:hypothetical protein
MNKLSKLSLAVIAALGLGLSGCGSSGTSSITPDFFSALVSRGDVYGATVTDSASTPHIAVQVEGKNEYTFDVPESDIVFPIKVNGGYIDVNDNGIIEADIDTKLNIEMESYDGTVTPVSTYLADETSQADRDAKLQDLVDTLNANSDTTITMDDLLKPASDVDFDTAVAINAVYSELVTNNSNSFTIEDVNGSFTTIKEQVRSRNGSSSVDIEEYTMDDLSIPTLTQDDIDVYLDSLPVDLSSIKSVSDLQGQTLYTMDLEADPATYTKLELPDTIDTDTDVTVTSYTLEGGEWVALPETDVTATATLDSTSDDLTLVVNDGSEEITNTIDSISLDGTELATKLSIDDLSTDSIESLTTQDSTDSSIYLEMTVEMKDPSTISTSTTTSID